MSALLVLPSPFLGPEPYRPLLGSLRSVGYDASVAPSPDRPVAADLLTTWCDLTRRAGQVALLAHSNAGYLAPAVSAAAGGVPVVFVDAALPTSEGSTRLAPPAFRSQLAALAGDDGLLPRWTRWWPRAEASATLPDPWFDRLDAVLPRVPLAYVDSEVPVPPGWSRGPHAYLAFGSTYAEELVFARSQGWPTSRLDAAAHLHLLLEPDETAAAIAALATSLAP